MKYEARLLSFFLGVGVKNIALVLGLALGSSSSFGAFLRVDLAVRFAYQDMDSSCIISDRVLGVSLSGTIKDGKVVQATMRNMSDSLVRIVLLPEELQGITTKVSAAGDNYISTWKISARLLNWLFFHIDIQYVSFGGCKPSRALATLTPYGHTYNFGYETALDLVTSLQRFRGVRSDGTPYAIKFGFYQRQSDQSKLENHFRWFILTFLLIPAFAGADIDSLIAFLSHFCRFKITTS